MKKEGEIDQGKDAAKPSASAAPSSLMLSLLDEGEEGAECYSRATKSLW